MPDHVSANLALLAVAHPVSMQGFDILRPFSTGLPDVVYSTASAPVVRIALQG